MSAPFTTAKAISLFIEELVELGVGDEIVSDMARFAGRELLSQNGLIVRNEVEA